MCRSVPGPNCFVGGGLVLCRARPAPVVQGRDVGSVERFDVKESLLVEVETRPSLPKEVGFV